MKIKVSLNNSGGELDSRVVDSETMAARAAIKMIKDAGLMRSGDTITFVELES